MIMICQTCRRVLNTRAGNDGVGYIHAFQDPDDHDVIPIPWEDGALGRCDFCNVEHPGYVVPARDFSQGLVIDGADHMSGGDWAACGPCAELISADRWTELSRRSAESHLRLVGTPLTDKELTMLRGLHRTLRKNITGAIRPL